MRNAFGNELNNFQAGFLFALKGGPADLDALQERLRPAGTTYRAFFALEIEHRRNPIGNADQLDAAVATVNSALYDFGEAEQLSEAVLAALRLIQTNQHDPTIHGAACDSQASDSAGEQPTGRAANRQIIRGILGRGK